MSDLDPASFLADLHRKLLLDWKKSGFDFAPPQPGPLELGAGAAEDYARVAMNYMPWIEYVEVESLGNLTVKVRPLDKNRRALPQAECDDLKRVLMKTTSVATRLLVPGVPPHDKWAAYGAFSLSKRRIGVVKNLVP